MKEVVETHYIFKTKSKRLFNAIKIIQGDRKLQELVISAAKIKNCKKRNLILRLMGYLKDQ